MNKTKPAGNKELSDISFLQHAAVEFKQQIEKNPEKIAETFFNTIAPRMLQDSKGVLSVEFDFAVFILQSSLSKNSQVLNAFNERLNRFLQQHKPIHSADSNLLMQFDTTALVGTAALA